MKKNLTVPIIAILAILVIVMSSLYFTKKPETAPAAEPDSSQTETLNAEIAEMTRRIDEQKTELEEKNSRIDALTAEIGEKTAEIETLKTEIAEKTGQIGALKEVLTEALNVIQPEDTEPADPAGETEAEETAETVPAEGE